METIYIVIALVLGTIIWFVMKPIKFKEDKNNQTPPPPYSEPQEIITIDDPVENDPEPINPGEIITIDDPVENDPEMPIKPLPVNCQYAIFRPAPETYYYIDCCGVVQEGEGYQPWEKRSPVAIDASKDFKGMDLIGDEAQVDC